MVDARIDCEEKVSMQTRKSDVGLSSSGNLSSGSREASKLNGSVEEVVGHRRSQRVSNQQNVVDEHVEESSSGKPLDEVDLIDDEKSLDEVLKQSKTLTFLFLFFLKNMFF